MMLDVLRQTGMGVIRRAGAVLRRIPLTSKMVILTVIVGFVVWLAAGYFETLTVKRSFENHLLTVLEREALEDRRTFDSYVKAHSQAAKILASQKTFLDYIEGKGWTGRSAPVIKLHRDLPGWLPRSSVLRMLVQVRYALLLDPEGRVREVYQVAPEPLPGPLRSPSVLLRQLSHSQNFMTRIEGKPFLITAETARGEGEKPLATLMLASPLDEEFLVASQGASTWGTIVSLVGGTPPRILVSSRSDLLPQGTPLSNLERSYLVAGKEFFDYGASDLPIGFASFIPRTEVVAVTEEVIAEDQLLHTLIAAMFIISFASVMYWVTKRIGLLTRRVEDFSREALGGKEHAERHGDQLHILEERFQGLTEEVLKGRAELERRVEERTSELKEERDRAQSYFDIAGVMFLVLGADRKVRLINNKGCEMLGYDEKDIVGRDWFDNFIPENVRDEMKEVFGKLMAGEVSQVEYYENKVLARDGGERMVAWHNSLITDDADNITGTLSSGEDITERREAENILRGIAESVSLKTGQEYFKSLVEYIASQLGTEYVFIGQLVGENQKIKTVTVYARGEIAENFEYDLHGTPCDNVVRKGICFFPREIQAIFPKDKLLADMGAESYAGIPLFASDGSPLGMIAALGLGPMKESNEKKAESLLQIFSARASSELERRMAEEERKSLISTLNTLVDHMPEGVLLLDADSRVSLANPVGREYLLSLSETGIGEVLTHIGGRPVKELLVSPPMMMWHDIETVGPDSRVFEVAGRTLDSQGTVFALRDVTEKRELSRRMQTQERMAAVGQLAAGIAHDFNNILTVINGYAEILLTEETLPPKIKGEIVAIMQSGNKAVSLIQQILDFSRSTVGEMEAVDLVPLVKEFLKFIERAIPENIRISLVHEPVEYVVMADVTKIQQVLANLVVNARDAMPEGGELRVEVSRLRLGPGDNPHLAEMPHGDWVALGVSDSGRGVPPGVLPHIFEPFFTTKKVGQGTGLGLSQVYGLVKQHKGYIDVDTGDRGSTFTVYLPAASTRLQEEDREDAVAGTPKGHGQTVLVAEDDDTVRDLVRNVLESLGYKVLTATDGKEALKLFMKHKDEIGLVITDLIMPELDGIQLSRILKKHSPSIIIMALSGYTLGVDGKSLSDAGIVELVQKPFKVQTLAKAVSGLLGKDRG